MVGAPSKSLRADRDGGNTVYGSSQASGVLSAPWRGSKGPPANWMIRQRQAAWNQAAENVFSTSDLLFELSMKTRGNDAGLR